MMSSKMNYGLVTTIAGATLAFLIGSGFASGQEILQYFTAYRYESILVAITATVIMVFANYCFIMAGNREKFTKGSEVFKFYCGPAIGLAFDYFAAIFCYMSFVVMLGGMGATVAQQFGFPQWTGAVGMALMAGATVVFGLNAMVSVISKIGPIIVGLSLLIGVYSLVTVLDQLPEGARLLESGEVTVMKASTNWFFAGCSYGGFCMMWLAGFMAKLGTENPQKELQIGQAIGVAGLLLACVVVGFAQLGNIRQIAGTQVPNLILAQQLSSTLAHGFAVLIILAIYSSACPLLWTVSARFAAEGTSRFRVLTITLAAAGLFVALKVPFNTLVNYIYVINGYGGALLIFFMVVKLFRMKSSERRAGIKEGAPETA
ncbi:hypothetical protein LJB99_03155 [Deltaproteobacteria bacterium OttesenSCG-928-K17]|nr:hypothetical protein [Deltaproteobacteria bacterium OttesenSCG-928-K17]